MRDEEAPMVAAYLPTEIPDIGQYLPANAYVCMNNRCDPPRLEIWPNTGGWLGIEIDRMVADMAPWHG
jgi:hypothetical protein